MQRLKDLRTLTRDPTAASKARAAENEAAGLKSIDLAASATTSGAPKKKPVFKSTLQPHNAGAVNVTPAVMLSGSGGVPDDEDPTGMVRNGFLEGGEDGGEMYVPEGVVGEECGGEGCWICRCKGKVGGGPKA